MTGFASVKNDLNDNCGHNQHNLYTLAAEDDEAGAVVEVVFDADVCEAGGGEEGGGFDAEGFVDFDYAGAVC